MAPSRVTLPKAEMLSTLGYLMSGPVTDSEERRDMRLLKKRDLPTLYWNLIVRGRA